MPSVVSRSSRASSPHPGGEPPDTLGSRTPNARAKRLHKPLHPRSRGPRNAPRPPPATKPRPVRGAGGTGRAQIGPSRRGSSRARAPRAAAAAAAAASPARRASAAQRPARGPRRRALAAPSGHPRRHGEQPGKPAVLPRVCRAADRGRVPGAGGERARGAMRRGGQLCSGGSGPRGGRAPVQGALHAAMSGGQPPAGPHGARMDNTRPPRPRGGRPPL
jgi:hypothetical protein